PKGVVMVVVLKVIAAPVLGGILAILFGLSSGERMVIMLLMASPTAAMAYVLAKELAGDERLTASAILWSTLLAPFAYSLIIGI
ncbi:MAG: AEC family transporter, partial [Planctomycetes bacterium]|nr:AEC family transporter [Planctomycetota bacterium]